MFRGGYGYEYESDPGYYKDSGSPAPQNIGEAVQDLLDFAQRDTPTCPTGYSTDDICGEVSVGEMALVWARSGAGKSTYYLNIIANTPHIPTLVVNMEMTARRQVHWLCSMANDLGVPNRHIEQTLKDPNHYAYADLRKALDGMGEHFQNLHFFTPTRPAVGDISEAVDELEEQTGIRPVRVFIDHIGLMEMEDESRGAYSKITSGLHDMAMKKHLAVFALQQVKRSSGDGAQNDGHLPVTLGSGVFAGEADADWIYGLYRPGRDPKFSRPREYYEINDKVDEYWRLRDEYDKVRFLTKLQVIKNRPFSELVPDGVDLQFDDYSKRLIERGARP